MAKKTAIAVNSYLDLYFYALIVGLVLICLVSVWKFRKGTLQVFFVVSRVGEQGGGRSLGSFSNWGANE